MIIYIYITYHLLREPETAIDKLRITWIKVLNPFNKIKVVLTSNRGPELCPSTTSFCVFCVFDGVVLCVSWRWKKRKKPKRPWKIDESLVFITICFRGAEVLRFFLAIQKVAKQIHEPNVQKGTVGWNYTIEPGLCLIIWSHWIRQHSLRCFDTPDEESQSCWKGPGPRPLLWETVHRVGNDVWNLSRS